jgi:hypothetical protein
MDAGNYTPYRGFLTQTTITWAATQSQPGSPEIDYLYFEGNCNNRYWNTNITTSPALVVPPYSAGGGACSDLDVAFDPGDTRADWFAYLDSGAWIGEVCVQLDFYFPDDPEQKTCPVNSCADFGANPPTPTSTPTNTRPPTRTFTPSNTRPPTNTSTPSNTRPPTNTFTPRPPTNTPTNTYTPSNTRPPTNTYTPSNTRPPTNTPIPTNTRPPTNTFTPVPPTNTPTPVPPTNTPTNTPRQIE